jgi:predicted NBD/HSP70 family sugar kinase
MSRLLRPSRSPRGPRRPAERRWAAAGGHRVPRAIVSRFTALAGPKAAVAVKGVREVADQARVGSSPARAVLDEAFEALGPALGPWIIGFGASVLVMGGSITRAWDLIVDPFTRGLFTRGLRTAGPTRCSSGRAGCRGRKDPLCSRASSAAGTDRRVGTGPASWRASLRGPLRRPDGLQSADQPG